jgi:molybdopterin synthase catalytic subunit
MSICAPNNGSNDWVGLAVGPPPVSEAIAWATSPECGGVVCFCGTVRDHSEGRPGVVSLEYEAYEAHVVPRLAQVAEAARKRVPQTHRVVLLHRVGTLSVGEVSVVVVASAPHRAEAFEAARFLIDTVKTSVPIWKRETWAEGSDWAQCAHPITGTPTSPAS